MSTMWYTEWETSFMMMMMMMMMTMMMSYLYLRARWRRPARLWWHWVAESYLYWDDDWQTPHQWLSSVITDSTTSQTHTRTYNHWLTLTDTHWHTHTHSHTMTDYKVTVSISLCTVTNHTARRAYINITDNTAVMFWHIFKATPTIGGEAFIFYLWTFFLPRTDIAAKQRSGPCLLYTSDAARRIYSV